MRMYLNKSFKKILLLLVLVTGVLGGLTQSIVEGQVVSGSVNNLEVFKEGLSVRDNNLYSTIHGETQILQFHEASLSPNKLYIAYTKKRTDNWGIQPYVYVYNTKTNLESSIPIQDDYIDKYVDSWSNDSKYLLLVDKSQSVGSVRGKIINIIKNREEMSLEMYDHSNIWLNNKLFYAETKKECNDSCTITAVVFKELETHKFTLKELRHEKVTRGHLPKYEFINANKPTPDVRLNGNSDIDPGKSLELINLVN